MRRSRGVLDGLWKSGSKEKSEHSDHEAYRRALMGKSRRWNSSEKDYDASIHHSLDDHDDEACDSVN